MTGKNSTAVTEIFILGLTDDPTLRVFFFVVFLGIYIVILLGNLSIVIVIQKSSQLHTPMYLFLSHLAFVDIGLSSSVMPVMLMNFLGDITSIPLQGCVVQLCSIVGFGTAEGFLLAVMASDRYVAICSPLLYSTHMSTRVCTLLPITSYLGGCVNAWIFAGCFLNLSFCGPNKINHFFCDYPSLLKLSCSHVPLADILPSFSAGSIIVIAVLIITISYAYILFSVLKIRSIEGRSKAFSTCTSHLTAITLYFGTITFIYVMPKSVYSTDQNKVVSLFYSAMIPMLNPLIYSLRNKEVKGAMKKLIAVNTYFYKFNSIHR
ncbi:olfactory receptor 480-like [Vombatus ursinus]|uniref:olfactory receptor 480-like n=1 Tax=Vombatus ursinus TaxID=29139 RepID=UPI000FFD8339|nr:olfactory receptor 480-like [Vombatus ursinus]